MDLNITNNITKQIYGDNDLIYYNLVYANNFTESIETSWQFREIKNFNPLNFGVLIAKSLIRKENGFVVLKNDEYALNIHYGIKKVHIDLAGIDSTILDKIYNQLIGLFPPYEEIDGRVHVNFWNNSKNGPINNIRPIAIPKWEEIEHNYAAKTKKALKELFKDFRPSSGGQLILWHGVPGTGKTFALRALCEEWKSWCTTEYILDPESLFSDPNYLTTMLFSDEESYDPDGNIIEKPTWKLFILEDTGELLSEDAKARTGQGLSRLLNLADGFIGQGTQAIVLITTNEKMDKLHPAVSRPGRCAASITFESLNSDEIREWAQINKVDIPENFIDRFSEKTIAELYDYINSQKQILNTYAEKNSVGFKIA